MTQIPVEPVARAGPVFPVAARGGRRRPVRVFEHDPDLLAGLDPATARVARQRCVADSMVVDRGRWRPPSEAQLGPAAIGLLVLDGLITRTVRLEATESPELIGEGDLLRPWDVDSIEGSLGLQPQWSVLQRATIAILDERFARRACCAPAIVSALLSRTMRRSRGLAFQLAIAHLRHAEARVRLLFWHLAERWGRVTPDGVVVPLALTHAMVARLVCMRRPTVSAKLTLLGRSGELTRRPDGTWLIAGTPPAALPVAEAAAAARRAAA